MPESDLLGPLVDAIETVKQRIREHGSSLRENETRTRVALIDPILQALGWDVSDPSSVTLEYDVSGRRADYALLRSEGKPAATIEAKKLGENLQQHRMQMLNYANASGVDYAGLTDGDTWELYDVFKRGELQDRQLLGLTLSQTTVNEAALRFLLLWRPNTVSISPAEATEPVTGGSAEGESTPAVPHTQISDTSYSSTAPSLTRNPIAEHGELSLVEYEERIKAETVGNPARRNRVGPDGRPIRQAISKPKTIRFPGESPLQINSSYEVLVNTADWLLRRNQLSIANTPFTRRTGRHIVSRDSAGMDKAKGIGGGAYFVETKLSQANVCSLAIELLKHCGVNPSEIRIQPGP